ncbi:hypothetical protein B0H16DRAFT_1456051 [Mycena metata]|uniref:Uncharacterized protein n=1 Tax=Mycena metata TaxID=1033252 RepID=A0AAD7JFD2_9AGAR|nr:hypothetical protein B0H16DRAFT_1456051 [Mycena metata]
MLKIPHGAKWALEKLAQQEVHSCDSWHAYDLLGVYSKGFHFISMSFRSSLWVLQCWFEARLHLVPISLTPPYRNMNIGLKLAVDLKFKLRPSGKKEHSAYFAPVLLDFCLTETQTGIRVFHPFQFGGQLGPNLTPNFDCNLTKLDSKLV